MNEFKLRSPNIVMNVLGVLVLGLCFVEYVEARDLVTAARTAQSQVQRIGVATLGVGIAVGATLFAIGLANLGRGVLISGAVGAVALLGGPSLLSLIGRIFGASAN